MHKGLVCVVLVACGGNTMKSTGHPDASATSDGTSTGDSGVGGMLGDCPIFPAATGAKDYSYWNADITGAGVDPLSSQYIASIGTGTNLHPDFGSTFGIPFVTVPGTQPMVQVSFDVADESDPGPYPFPPDAPVEVDTDGHVLVIDRDNCKLYELGNSIHDTANNTWSGYAGAVFDLTKPTLRPEKWTSADASGGSIFVGLARYDEVATGAIHHALRFTVDVSQHAYVHPATHYASADTSTNLPPMGLRVRIKASACPGLLAGAGASHPQSKVIVQAMCTYGLILADNGSNWFVTGAPDPRWDDDDLNYIKTIAGSNFEAIATGALTTH